MDSIEYRGYVLDFRNLPAPDDQVIRCRAIHARLRRLSIFEMTYEKVVEKAKRAIDEQYLQEGALLG